MKHLGTQRLETQRLILRRFEMRDLEPMYENCWRHKSVTQWTSYATMDCLEDVCNNAEMFTEKWLSYDNPKRYSWATADEILKWNNIADPSTLQIGQKLKIYKKK